MPNERNDHADGAPYSSSHAAEHDRSDTRGKDTSRLLNAVTFGAAGAVGGGVAGTLVGWGGIGIAAAGGAVGFPVVVPVVVGAAAGVGTVAAARALREPVARATSAVRQRVGDAALEETEEGASGAAEATSVNDSGVEDVESRSSRAKAAAAAVGAAAAVAGASLIPELRRRIFRNAATDQTRVPPHARRQLYEKQLGRCKGCRNHYLFKDMTLDHIVPRARGGANDLANLQLLCHHCNASKGIRSWDGFRKDKQPSTPDTSDSCPPDDPSEHGDP